MPKVFTQKISINIWPAIGLLIVVAVVGVGVGVKHPEWATLGQPTQAPNFSSLDTLYSQLQKKFDGTLSPAQVLQGARAGLVSAAGDPYTVYLSSQAAKDLNDSLSGTLSGIGIEVGIKNNLLKVIAPVAGTPAAKAGLQSGDIIAAIDGVSSSNYTLDQAVGKIRGPKGTQVKLTIIRGTTTPNTLTITRDIINVPSVTTKTLPGNIGYIQITQFNTDTGTLVTQAASKFKAAGVTKIILDLRDDPGGYLDQAVTAGSQFLPKGNLIVQERRGTTVINSYSSDGGDLNNAKIVVLINSGSASASEILAGALHDNKRAELVGATSFGKGSVQQVVGLAGGNELKVTVAHWYTPGGVNINKAGIRPDVAVPLTQANSDAGQDPQLDAAVARLQ